MLRPFVLGAEDDKQALALHLRPDEVTFERIFGGHAAAVRERYHQEFPAPPVPRARPEQVAIRVFAGGGPTGRPLPTSWSPIVGLLNPDVVWCSFRFHHPEARLGMAFDGLAWSMGHWAWFPKLWRWCPRA